MRRSQCNPSEYPRKKISKYALKVSKVAGNEATTFDQNAQLQENPAHSKPKAKAVCSVLHSRKDLPKGRQWGGIRTTCIIILDQDPPEGGHREAIKGKTKTGKDPNQ